MLRTALTMLLNWAACSGIVLWLEDQAPWQWFALFDAMAAIIVTIRPASKAQAAIGAIYVAEIVAHSGYGIAGILGRHPDVYFYLGELDKLAFFQVLLLGGWASGRGLRSLARHWIQRRRLPSGSAYLARMD